MEFTRRISEIWFLPLHEPISPTNMPISSLQPASSSAFCSSPLPICRTDRTARHSRFTCLHSPSSSRPISRRAALSILASIFASTFRKGDASANAESPPLTGFVTRSGIKYFDFTRGDGPTPKWGDYVNIDYVAYTLNESGDTLTKHDSSYKYSDDGYLIHHGNGQLILGLEEMIHTMRVGGKRRAIIPAAMGYIGPDLGPLPAWDRDRRKFSKALNEVGGVIVFDVEVQGIYGDEESRRNYNDLLPTPEQVSDYLEDRITTLE